jgi:hypothetical protein
MVRPFFAGLYEALPVWVWAKQKPEIKSPKARAALKNFINFSFLHKLDAAAGNLDGINNPAAE